MKLDRIAEINAKVAEIDGENEDALTAAGDIVNEKDRRIDFLSNRILNLEERILASKARINDLRKNRQGTTGNQSFDKEIQRLILSEKRKIKKITATMDRAMDEWENTMDELEEARDILDDFEKQASTDKEKAIKEINEKHAKYLKRKLQLKKAKQRRRRIRNREKQRRIRLRRARERRRILNKIKERQRFLRESKKRELYRSLDKQKSLKRESLKKAVFALGKALNNAKNNPTAKNKTKVKERKKQIGRQKGF